jgi:anti-anti-sigma factor
MQLLVVKDEPDELAIWCEGEVTQRNYMPNPLVPLLGEGGFSRKVMLDLRGVTFLGSDGLGWLFMNNNRFQDAGGRFVVHSIPEAIANVFALVKAHEVINLELDEDAARIRLHMP